MDRLDFAVNSRRIGVLGPNGAGKTTLLKLLTGGLAIQTGHLTINTHDLATRDGLRATQLSLGYVPQHLEAMPGYTVAEFLRYVAWLRRVAPHQVDERVTGAAAAVGLSEVLDAKLRQLSGGQRRRATLAQALVNSPACVVLDEPTVGLDPAQRAEYRRLLRQVPDATTVIIATHLTDDVAALCDAAIVLDAGTTRFCGSVQQLAATTGGDSDDGRVIESAYLQLMGHRPG